jgi:threonine dehydrogenase-like Zn-dependent dehydrogenase
MKALFFDGKLDYREDIQTPRRRPDEALIKVTLAGICRTDQEITRGYMGFTGIPGHEFVGVVEDDRYPELNGKRIVGEINCPCGKCATCQKGLGNHCPTRTVLGITKRHGVFAEYTMLPKSNLHEIPDSLSDEEAVFVEPLAAAIQVTTQVPISTDTEVVILGAGKLGLLIAQVIGRISQRTTLIGKHPSKLRLINDVDINLKTLKEFSKGAKKKVQLVVECTGSPAGVKLAKEIVSPRGTIVLKSTSARSTSFNFSHLVVDEVTIIGSRCGPFPSAIQMLNRGEVSVRPLISATFHLKDGTKAFREAQKKNSAKVLLSML